MLKVAFICIIPVTLKLRKLFVNTLQEIYRADIGAKPHPNQIFCVLSPLSLF